MSKLLERIIEVGMVLALVYLLTGCNAINGIGRDLQQMSDNYVEPAEK